MKVKRKECEIAKKAGVTLVLCFLGDGPEFVDRMISEKKVPHDVFCIILPYQGARKPSNMLFFREQRFFSWFLLAFFAVLQYNTCRNTRDRRRIHAPSAPATFNQQHSAKERPIL